MPACFIKRWIDVFPTDRQISNNTKYRECCGTRFLEKTLQHFCVFIWRVCKVRTVDIYTYLTYTRSERERVIQTHDECFLFCFSFIYFFLTFCLCSIWLFFSIRNAIALIILAVRIAIAAVRCTIKGNGLRVRLGIQGFVFRVIVTDTQSVVFTMKIPRSPD